MSNALSLSLSLSQTIVQILPYDSVELVNKEEELDRTEYNVRFSHIPPIQVMHVFDG